MLLKKGKKPADTRTDQITGVYVPKDRRIEQKKGFCSAHFQLGQTQTGKSVRDKPLVLSRFQTEVHDPGPVHVNAGPGRSQLRQCCSDSTPDRPTQKAVPQLQLQLQCHQQQILPGDISRQRI